MSYSHERQKKTFQLQNSFHHTSSYRLPSYQARTISNQTCYHFSVNQSSLKAGIAWGKAQPLRTLEQCLIHLSYLTSSLAIAQHLMHYVYRHLFSFASDIQICRVLPRGSQVRAHTLGNTRQLSFSFAHCASIAYYFQAQRSYCIYHQ